jgi:hypothetical protein
VRGMVPPELIGPQDHARWQVALRAWARAGTRSQALSLSPHDDVAVSPGSYAGCSANSC